jgi:hypothetical protein
LWPSIEWPFQNANDTVSILANQIVIYEKSEEETHNIKIVDSIAKKLSSEWLNVQNSIDSTNASDPISCGAVKNALDEFQNIDDGCLDWRCD